MIGSTSSLGGFQIRMVHHLNNLQRESAQAEQRISTGKRINSAADDPSGFTFVSRHRSRLSSLDAAVEGANRAQALAEVGSGALDDVSEQLDTIRTNVQSALAGGLTETELEALQIEINDAVSAIDRIASGTTFGSRALLDGSTITTSGENASQIERLSVVDASDEIPSQSLDVEVTTQASQASLTYQGNVSAAVTSDATFTVTGSRGSATFSVLADDDLTDVADAINAETENTGVSAAVVGDQLQFSSERYGSEAEIEVTATSGTFAVTGGNGDGTANGVDAVATINGRTVTADGNHFAFRSDDLDVDLSLVEGTGTGQLDTVTITNSPLRFQVGASIGESANLSLPDVSTSSLGGTLGSLDELTTGGKFDLATGDLEDALSVVEDAQSTVLLGQTRVGSFISTTLGSALNVMAAEQESLTSAIATVEDADVATELAIQTKNEILAEATLNAIINSSTNFLPGETLSLLLNRNFVSM